MLQLAVGPGKHQRLVPVIEADEVRRAGILSPDLEHLTVPLDLADARTVDHHARAHCDLHAALPLPIAGSSWASILRVRVQRCQGSLRGAAGRWNDE